jgi:hypothetical protein
MAKHPKTLALVALAREILSDLNPQTVRQVYYQLVSRQVIKNSRTGYQAVSNALVDARREGVIPWEWIEDRTRRPRTVDMWTDLADFVYTVQRAYRRDVWDTQPGYVECWLEKDALSGIFESVLAPYGVTLNVGRGYDGWSSIRNASERYAAGDGVTVLYFGDFDPSGEDMVRSLRDRLRELGSAPEILKCALTAEDVRRYELPPDFTKPTDTRSASFVIKFGDVSVELDALPGRVLQARVREEVEKRMDLPALALVKEQEDQDRERLTALLTDAA